VSTVRECRVETTLHFSNETGTHSVLPKWDVYKNTDESFRRRLARAYKSNLMDIYYLNFCILSTAVKYFVHSFRMTLQLEDKETENSVNDGSEVRTSYNNVFC